MSSTFSAVPERVGRVPVGVCPWRGSPLAARRCDKAAAPPPTFVNDKGVGTVSHREQMRRALVDAAAMIPAQDRYQPWKGVLDDGTEVLVTVQQTTGVLGGQEYDYVASVEVAFRAKRQHSWGPPVELERAP